MRTKVAGPEVDATAGTLVVIVVGIQSVAVVVSPDAVDAADPVEAGAAVGSVTPTAAQIVSEAVLAAWRSLGEQVAWRH